MKALRLLKIFILLLGTFPKGFTQAYPLLNLSKDSKEVMYITRERAPLFETPDKAFTTHPQQLLKKGGSTYVFINGTGRLYKAIQSSGTFIFQRMDSTTHFGYNIAAFPFSFQNRIYNIGGYGLWRINGQLRVFNEKDRQWDIVKLNEEVPFLFDESNNLLWYDTKKGKIYLGYAMYRNEAIGGKDIDETKLDFVTRVLDLSALQWSSLGLLNKTLSDKIQVINTIGMCPWGQLILLGDKINLIDYKRNRVLLLKINNPSYQSIVRKRLGNTFYFKDSTLFYGNNAAKTLDSIPMQYADFEPTGEPVYHQPIPDGFLSAWEARALVILAIFTIIAWWISKNYTISIRNKKILKEQVRNPFDNGNQIAGKIIFEEKETQVISLLVDNSEKGLFTSIDDINKILGLTKRSLEIQKKQRSDTIISINKKYTQVYPEIEAIIQKQRSDLDKRSFEYYIDHTRLETLKPLILNGSPIKEPL